MLGCPPKSIITDQDKAIKNAIEVVFSSTQHRWCLWLYNDSITPDEFEERWTMFLENFHVSNNEWLNGLYVERQRWVLAFVKNSFWAGMSSTQHSESMHAFFDGYVNSKTSLKQFVEQYENALHDKVEKEKHADFNSLNTQITCITHYAIEKQFQAVYTNTKFREFQQEVTSKLYCEVSPFPNNILSENFIVKEYVQVGEDNHRSIDFTVHLNEVGCEINCSCRLFESKGILCRHAIAVLIRQGIFCVPNKYILKRWRKDVKRCHSKVKISYDNWDVKPEGQHFDKMCNSFYEVEDLATNNEAKFCMVMEAIECLKAKLTLDARDERSSQCGANLIEDAIGNGELNSNILTPRVAKSNGRPPYKRRQSKVEQIVWKKKKGKQREMKLADNNNCLKDQKAVESAEVATINIESFASLGCHIFGTQESTALEALDTLDLSQNRFSGTVPKSFGNLTKISKIFNLDLSHNSLVDPFPVMNVEGIESLDLSYNTFHLNQIPKWVTSSLIIYSLKLAKCGLKLKLDDWKPAETYSYDYIDLSENKISGSPVPLLNRTDYLVGFWVSGNMLKFNIESLRIVKRLKNLNLSRNLVFGKLPEAVSGLDKLNVSYNHLCGKIPAAKFPATAYVGNDCLCGSPLQPCKE
ncbi:hypothetical protein LWI28_000842 [Acer negundo]|uniref:Protein FAR1-RELATED SEQUENCE n=1 Tax=Acer negundo TaxID=4023 RepID=A0AAD5JR32_ACENE|nr:hypothetical protein LWI28_000842 [Acer negundo]